MDTYDKNSIEGENKMKRKVEFLSHGLKPRT